MNTWIRYVFVALYYSYLAYSVLLVICGPIEFWITREIRWLAVGLIGVFFLYYYKPLWDGTHTGPIVGMVLGGFTSGGLVSYLFVRQQDFPEAADSRVSRVMLIASIINLIMIVICGFAAAIL